MDLLLGEILNLCNFQIVHLGPNSGFIEIISEITWYGFDDFQIYFEYFQCCGDMMMKKIVDHFGHFGTLAMGLGWMDGLMDE